MIEEKLQSLIDDYDLRVNQVVEEAIIEIERLREYEFMYQSCSK